jgi:DNA replication and repair protein RecF
VLIRRLWLTDFRSYATAEVSFSEDLTAIIGRNGQGKSNLIEAIGYLATLSSFRGAPTDALVRVGAPRAFVRAEAEREGRKLLLEAELVAGGRNRAQLNRQPLRRARDLLGALRVTVFSPDDLTIVKSGPGERRRFLDEALVAVHPRNDALIGDVDRILRQRNALLKQAGGRKTTEIELTLDVFDAKLATAGEALARARAGLVSDLSPILSDAYARVAQRAVRVDAVYDPPWLQAGLLPVLHEGRSQDVKRGVTLAGPHRDDLGLMLGGLSSRAYASQGEQRSLALALRLAAHDVVTRRTGTSPVLLLDDVFSELDPDRSDALMANLPAGQTVLSTASGLPSGAAPGRVLTVRDGMVGEA